MTVAEYVPGRNRARIGRCKAIFFGNYNFADHRDV